MLKHGMEGTPTYKSWNNMMMRCYNPKRINYREYGGSGITVCDKWHTFQGFFEDMGVRPDGTSLNRKEGSLIYSKETCEWATYSEQSFDQKRRSTNISGRTGVSFQTATSKWKAEISKDGKTYFLGYFTSFEEAVKVREDAEIKHFGRKLTNGQENTLRKSKD